MILQGVGHPRTYIGVCYANDPKTRGYMAPVPALDLTTSLRGDLVLSDYSHFGRGGGGGPGWRDLLLRLSAVLINPWGTGRQLADRE